MILNFRIETTKAGRIRDRTLSWRLPFHFLSGFFEKSDKQRPGKDPVTALTLHAMSPALLYSILYSMVYNILYNMMCIGRIAGPDGLKSCEFFHNK